MEILLPLKVDLTPDGRIVEKADIGEEGYAENIECTLQLSFGRDSVFIHYYTEDDDFLNESQIKKVFEISNH